MTVDRTVLATDLEGLGLKAIAGAVRRGHLTIERVMRSVERMRDRKLGVGDSKGAEEVQVVLDRYQGNS